MSNKIILQRVKANSTDNSIIGKFKFGGVEVCDTLENPKYQIPAGTYNLSITYSPRFRRNLPILDVKGRSGIRIHVANYPQQLQGCIAVGSLVKNRADFIGNSAIALDKVYKLISVNNITSIEIKDYD